ncbi:hypothetical protein V8E54_008503 [Elaphomyces granulatus]
MFLIIKSKVKPGLKVKDIPFIVIDCISSNLMDQRLLCSSCAKPWQSTRYKTCDGCRGRRAEQRRAERPAGGVQQAVTDVDSSLINEEDRTRREMVEAEEVATRVRRKEDIREARASTANDRTFSPDTPDLIPSCLEEEFPRYATATEKFPPEITKENIRQRYNDYQRRIDWCADRSPCGICGGSFQSDSVTLYSSYRTSTSWIPVRYMTMVFISAIPVAMTWSLMAASLGPIGPTNLFANIDHLCLMISPW